MSDGLIEKLEAAKAKLALRPDLADTCSIQSAAIAYDHCIAIVKQHQAEQVNDENWPTEPKPYQSRAKSYWDGGFKAGVASDKSSRKRKLVNYDEFPSCICPGDPDPNGSSNDDAAASDQTARDLYRSFSRKPVEVVSYPLNNSVQETVKTSWTCPDCCVNPCNCQFMGEANPKLADARLDASEAQGSAACAMEETSPANQSEISVVDCRKEFESHPQFKYLDFDRDRDAWDRGKYKHSHVQALYEGFEAGRAMEPVMVDLEKCAEAIHQCHYHPVDWGSKEWRAMFEREKRLAIAMAKACLDAAGVKYGN